MTVVLSGDLAKRYQFAIIFDVLGNDISRDLQPVFEFTAGTDANDCLIVVDSNYKNPA